MRFEDGIGNGGLGISERLFLFGTLNFAFLKWNLHVEGGRIFGF